MVSASALTQAEELQSPLTKAAARCVLVLVRRLRRSHQTQAGSRAFQSGEGETVAR